MIDAKLGRFGETIVPAEKLTYDDIFTGFKHLVPEYYWQLDLAEVAWVNEATLTVTDGKGES